MFKSSDIAKELHISEQTVRAYARAGLIPYVETPGGHRRYVLEDVRQALAAAKKRSFEPLEEGDQKPRLTQEPSGTPLRRGHSRRRGITRATIAETLAGQEEQLAPIPFIGVRGSSRFVVDQHAEV